MRDDFYPANTDENGANSNLNEGRGWGAQSAHAPRADINGNVKPPKHKGASCPNSHAAGGQFAAINFRHSSANTPAQNFANAAQNAKPAAASAPNSNLTGNAGQNQNENGNAGRNQPNSNLTGNPAQPAPCPPLDKAAIREILAARFANDTHRTLSQLPLPSELRDCYKAAMRIRQAIERNEKIAVVGDYDVDGVVSSAIIADFLSLMGAQFRVKIPNRFTDGYGLSVEMIEEFRDADVIITVDNGITANDAAARAKALGICLIITDHHMPGAALPEAYAIVNPKQPACTFNAAEICGAQVAWYIVAALKEVCALNIDMKRYLDLLSVAIVADMMELRGMNRALVRNGFKRLNAGKRPCFEAMKLCLNRSKFEFDDISFLIAPLINSAGRMDDASISYQFLRAKTLGEATRLFEQIRAFNDRRKSEERQLFDELYAKVCADASYNDDSVLVLWGEGWHEGILGVLASRVTKRFGKPSIIFSTSEGMAKGSARSVGRFDILGLIATAQDILIGYGGHKGAAGVTIMEGCLPQFRARINASPLLKGLQTAQVSDDVLGEIDVNCVDGELLKILEEFEPYGQKNPRPFFAISGARVAGVRSIGRDNKHIKISLKKGYKSFEAMFFNYDYLPQNGELLDLEVSIGKNTFGGVTRAQMVVRSLRVVGN